MNDLERGPCSEDSRYCRNGKKKITKAHVEVVCAIRVMDDDWQIVKLSREKRADPELENLIGPESNQIKTCLERHCVWNSYVKYLLGIEYDCANRI